jgi:hypothetical protein
MRTNTHSWNGIWTCCFSPRRLSPGCWQGTFNSLPTRRLLFACIQTSLRSWCAGEVAADARRCCTGLRSLKQSLDLNPIQGMGVCLRLCCSSVP